MKPLFYFIACLCVTSLFSQSISKQVIASAGESITEGITQLTTTIGEPIIGPITNGAQTISQGFLAAVPQSTLSVDELLADSNLISIYPNPVINRVTIDIGTNVENPLQIQLYNITGQQVFNNTITQQKNTLNLSTLSSGTYIMQMTDSKTNTSKSFKIIKK